MLILIQLCGQPCSEELERCCKYRQDEHTVGIAGIVPRHQLGIDFVRSFAVTVRFQPLGEHIHAFFSEFAGYKASAFEGLPDILSGNLVAVKIGIAFIEDYKALQIRLA